MILTELLQMARKKAAKAAELEEDALIVEYLRQRQLKEQVCLHSPLLLPMLTPADPMLTPADPMLAPCWPHADPMLTPAHQAISLPLAEHSPAFSSAQRLQVCPLL